MNDSRIDVKQLAEEFSVPETTLRGWVSRLNIPVSRTRNKMYFEDDAVTMLRVIKQLRDVDSGFDTIQRRLSNEHDTVDQRAELLGQPNVSEFIDLQRAINESVTVSVTQAITEANGIAEKYAMAAHRVGQLEAEKRALEERLQLLPAPNEYYAMKSTIEKLEAENSQQKEQISQLTKSSGLFAWFKKLFA